MTPPWRCATLSAMLIQTCWGVGGDADSFIQMNARQSAEEGGMNSMLSELEAASLLKRDVIPADRAPKFDQNFVSKLQALAESKDADALSVLRTLWTPGVLEPLEKFFTEIQKTPVAGAAIKHVIPPDAMALFPRMMARMRGSMANPNFRDSVEKGIRFSMDKWAEQQLGEKAVQFKDQALANEGLKAKLLEVMPTALAQLPQMHRNLMSNSHSLLQMSEKGRVQARRRHTDVCVPNREISDRKIASFLDITGCQRFRDEPTGADAPADPPQEKPKTAEELEGDVPTNSTWCPSGICITNYVKIPFGAGLVYNPPFRFVPWDNSFFDPVQSLFLFPFLKTWKAGEGVFGATYQASGWFRHYTSLMIGFGLNINGIIPKMMFIHTRPDNFFMGFRLVFPAGFFKMNFGTMVINGSEPVDWNYKFLGQVGVGAGMQPMKSMAYEVTIVAVATHSLRADPFRVNKLFQKPAIYWMLKFVTVVAKSMSGTIQLSFDLEQFMGLTLGLEIDLSTEDDTEVDFDDSGEEIEDGEMSSETSYMKLETDNFNR